MIKTDRNFAQLHPQENGSGVNTVHLSVRGEPVKLDADQIDSSVSLLPIARYRLDLRLASTFIVPENIGSLIHGGIGFALKTIADQTPSDEKSGNPNAIDVYQYLFETRGGTTEAMRMPKASAIPRPYILEPPFNDQSIYYAGELIRIGLVLVGKAIRYLPVFVSAFEALGRRGIQNRLGCFDVSSVTELPIRYTPLGCDEWKLVTDDSTTQSKIEEQTLRFLTPTRLEIEHKVMRLVTFPILFRALLRRIRNLQHFYHAPGATSDDARLIGRADGVMTVRRDLVWVDQSRRSHGRWMPQGGFVGEITFRGELAEFIPFLKLGELIHLGKGATFGMGGYVLDGKPLEDKNVYIL